MKHLSTALLLIVCTQAPAQECGGGRYSTYDLFPAVDSTLAVPFGSNLDLNGVTQTLYMDVYEPTGDTLSARPVIVCAFGGSFVAGARADVAGFCRIMAKLGYVAIAPDYRVGFFIPNENSTTKAVMRCVHDLRGCVRYLRRSVAEYGNPYRIDPDRIIMGGVSAGAIGALHLAYLDEVSETPATLYPDTAALGGLEGNSGNPGYSSDVLAVYSFSGCLEDTSWIHPGDQPLVSVHEVGDGVVPYGTQQVSVFGIPTGLTASGSSDIHKRLDHIGIPNCFLSYPGSDHVGYLTYDPVTSTDFVVQFCASVVCGSVENCGTVYAAVEESQSLPDLGLFPNPASDVLHVGNSTGTAEVFDMQGRRMLSTALDNAQLDVRTLPTGAYRLVVHTTKGVVQGAFMVAR